MNVLLVNKANPAVPSLQFVASVANNPANFNVDESSGVILSPLEVVENWYAGVLASAPPLTQLGLREHIAAEWPKLVEALK